MDFQHPITEEMCIFSKPQTSQINCIAFRFHFPVIKPVDDESPCDNTRCPPRNIPVAGMLLWKGQDDWEGGPPITLNCPGNEPLGKQRQMK